MTKKFNFVNVILTFLLFLFPLKSFTTYANNNTITQKVGLYISGQYKPSIPHFKNFSVEENDKVVDLIGLTTDVTYITEHILRDNTKFNTHYIAKFKNNFINFSSAIGYYSGQGPRLEIESSYGDFDVVNYKNYAVQDVNRYFALVREKNGSNFSPKPHETSQPSDSNPKKSFYTLMKNNGVFVASVIINGCYDFSFNNTTISPYVCIGVGGDFIEFFEVMHIKFACQSKVGISYPISPSITIFADAHYHKVINNKFNNLHVKYSYELKNSPTITSATAKLNIEYFGGEVGMRFIF
ncbi:major outer membrane protein OMP-1U [Ehrlichia chaffeensis str. Arkansas]|uniref:Major outer membrane protein OMP-1U n=2 Tax=Ehrlichia chaffeensis TaxID=945 RepID=Q2GF73_EHRCR|nr:P44/Msp2 family outer membrane protein [Ehrlichia chaffeensis]AAF73413.1 P28-5 [Ehrlichia chaffeensis]AAK28664.1 major outer membrane protein OMP-1U [Ehrlichia chaffeensis]ABD44678.1 major outer membrane protein OMP-1U [Ehrlichia chaffeensis str. Arkansas]AHX07597.1 surface antigen family protein [Ehrlichia chaffeensis str. Osceola]